jgi:hypothetical protein
VASGDLDSVSAHHGPIGREQFNGVLGKFDDLPVYRIALDLGVGEDFKEYVAAALGGIGALGAAWLALLGVQRQIRHASELEDRRRKASLMAAKTVLPLALSDMAALSSNNARLNFNPGALLGSHSPARSLRELDGETLTVLRDCIEFADPIDGQALGDIIRTYQVLWARAGHRNRSRKLEPYKEDIASDHDMLVEALNWAALYAMVNRTFAYGRGEAENIAVVFEQDAVKSALQLCGIDFDIFPNMETLHDIKRKNDSLFVFPRRTDRSASQS